MFLSVRPSSPEKYNDKIKFQSFKGKTKKSFRFAPLINYKHPLPHGEF